ncbi:hypothetical protein RALTA_B0779 [Cupriavidus taiwanensis LMG 19424]|uniref:Uncharacterized protein n=1 Tax=Cupriavidus taiwanensis (strain DSM 17343 / BCRC 17206 / CCUG 44338 / CIP 107171 / LMG 19424 / R1) TaxID=977880 RepID=B3R920_CUPTR|nr:hypothetical protein RALTA_B0779 [Cupriavidus taiwanensis LMG 19424]
MPTANVERPARFGRPTSWMLLPSPPPLSRKRERGANKRYPEAVGLARDNACERSDALRASAQDLR